jgi:hypothetical protein
MTTTRKSNYFARVELHDADWPDDYEDLHNELAKVGFTPCVTFTKGGSKKLPTGFYYGKGRSTDLSKVFTDVSSAADATGYLSEISVIKSGGSRHRLSDDCD